MKKEKLKVISFTIGIISIALLSFSGTYAYLTGKDKESNKVVVGENKIDIIEEYNPPKEILPGTVITKKPSFKNTGNIDVCVRAKILFSNSDMQNLTEPIRINGGWTLSGDGYYYYNNKLTPNNVTPALFENIVVKSNASESEIKDFEVIIYSESQNYINGRSCESVFNN